MSDSEDEMQGSPDESSGCPADPVNAQGGTDNAGSLPEQAPPAMETGRLYEVGRGRPPKHGQIKEGEVRNPWGRRGKPTGSLTGRQATADLLRATSRPIKVRVGSRRVTMSVIDAIRQKQCAMALNGHGPSMRFLVKEHKLATEALMRFYPDLRTLQQHELGLTADGSEISQRDREALEYFQRQSLRLIDAGFKGKDPYVKKMEREAAAYLKRQEERQAKGIRPAVVVIDSEGNVAIADPARLPPAGDYIVIGVEGQRQLWSMARSRDKYTALNVVQYLNIRDQAYEELRAVFDEQGVPYTVTRDEAPPVPG